MRNKPLLLVVLGFVLCVAPWIDGQFLAPEISQREFWEDFLATADIVKFEEIGEGVTKPYRLTLKKGEIEARGAWKNPSGMQQGFLEGWQYEIAAYRLDKLIGLHMVPPTVEREFQGQKGSLQLWITFKTSLLQVMEEKIPIPVSAMERTDKMKYLTRAWDSLVANDDRTQQNVRFMEDWRTILIDHSRSFRSDKEHAERLIYGKNGIKTVMGRPALFRRLPRTFVEAVKAVDFVKIKNAVGPYLTDEEIGAVVARRALLLAEVEEMIKENGEDKVLYD